MLHCAFDDKLNPFLLELAVFVCASNVDRLVDYITGLLNHTKDKEHYSVYEG